MQVNDTTRHDTTRYDTTQFILSTDQLIIKIEQPIFFTLHLIVASMRSD